jgi:putative membrane protein
MQVLLKQNSVYAYDASFALAKLLGGQNMSETRFLSVHYFIRTFILLGFSSYIVFLSKLGALGYYIAPRMMIFVQASAVVLYVLACYQGYMALRACWGNRVICDCEHVPSRSFLRNVFAYGLFVLPLLFGFLLPNTAMNSALADKKGMNLAASTASSGLPTDDGTNLHINQNQGPTPNLNPLPNTNPAPKSTYVYPNFDTLSEVNK